MLTAVNTGSTLTGMRIDWPECENVRDLGGLPVPGGVTRTGSLVRADDLSQLSPAGVAMLRRAGVTSIFDLRGYQEIEESPGPFARDEIYRHTPFLVDVLPYKPPHDTYAPMLDHNRERIVPAFRALAEAPAGIAVVHCVGGRDRTGVLAALMLDLVGVAPEVIVDDYALSPDREPIAMRNTLVHLADRYGGAAGYLAALTPPELASLRARLAPAGRSTSPRSGPAATPATPPAR